MWDAAFQRLDGKFDVSAGEMTTLQRIVRLVWKEAAGLGGFSFTAHDVAP